jgi:hypothetical protein
VGRDTVREQDDIPEYMLILAWNFADEIIQSTLPYAEAGGKYIIPIPKPRIIDYTAIAKVQLQGI